jgi:SAM-dependent methyltransferase
MSSSAPKTYANFWDNYVTEFSVAKQAALNRNVHWPGDEWGNETRWRSFFDATFVPHVPSDVRLAMEIGPGAGKYTALFLEKYPAATVLAADVSVAYLSVLQTRCAELIAKGRIKTGLIETKHTALEDIASQHGVAAGALDVIFSIDAMVHVDLQYLVAYWMSARTLLKPGGKVIMTVADASRDAGFEKLVRDTAYYFPLQGQITSKFEWLCPEMVINILDRLGFEVKEVDQSILVRDFSFVATKRG